MSCPFSSFSSHPSHEPDEDSEDDDGLCSLPGVDTAYFNYEECDEDAELDDLDAMGRDAQDAYFSDDCIQEGETSARSRPRNRAEAMKRLQVSSRGGAEEEEYDY